MLPHPVGADYGEKSENHSIMKHSIYIYIIVMAVVTYLIRVLPLVLLKKEITSPFIKSFLFYVPFACLAAMTFPDILYSPSMFAAGVAGFVTALILSYMEKSMIVVALAACAAVYIVERLL